MMFSFLKGQYREVALKEYRRRLLSAAMALALLSALIFVGMAAPAYISLKGEAKALETEREAYSRKMAETGQAEVEGLIKEVVAMMAVIKEDNSSSLLVSVLEDVLSKKPDGISLSSVSFERKKGEWAVSIAGAAASRERLVEFTKSLESESGFRGIDLPISSLTKNKDVPFSMTFRSKF